MVFLIWRNNKARLITFNREKLRPTSESIVASNAKAVTGIDRVLSPERVQFGAKATALGDRMALRH